MKSDRQPMIILKALKIDSKDRLQSRSVLSELRRKADPSKKIIIAIDQKSLEQFLNDVRKSNPLSSLLAILILNFILGTTIRDCQ